MPTQLSGFILYISIMNNLNEKIGINSSLIIIVGCLLKAFHIQEAAVVLTSGFFILVLLSLWYALIDISKVPSPYSIL